MRRPFGMMLGLPREIENAVAVFHHASVLDLHADRNQRARAGSSAFSPLRRARESSAFRPFKTEAA